MSDHALRRLILGVMGALALHAWAQGPEAEKADDNGSREADSAKSTPVRNAPPAVDKGHGKDVSKGAAPLIVVVSRGDSRVAAARVFVLPAGANTELERITNQQGEARFAGLPLGTARVRVIAQGSPTAQKNATLEAAGLKIEVALQSEQQ